MNKKIDIGFYSELKEDVVTPPEEDQIPADDPPATTPLEFNQDVKSANASFTNTSFKQNIQDIIDQSQVEINHPTWDSIHIPVPDAIPNISIQTLSATLESVGFPPFPSNLFTSNKKSHSDQQKLVQALYWALENVLQEYRLKVHLSKHLQLKLKQLGDETKSLAAHVDDMQEQNNNDKAEHMETIKLLERKVKSLTSQLQEAEDAKSQTLKNLYAANEEAMKWKSKYNKVSEDLYREKERVAELVSKIAEDEEDKRLSMERAKEIAQTVVNQGSNNNRKKNSAAWKDIVDVVSFYEEKLRYSRGVAPNEDAKDTLAFGTQTDYRRSVNRPDSSPERTRIALLEEIKELREQLETTVSAFEEAQSEKELLKLKLLALKPGKEALKYGEVLTTRERIQRDKYNHKFKQYKIDELSSDESRIVLRKICESLNISAIGNIIESLQDVALTVRLVPKMQNFIRAVDEAVWSTDPEQDAFQSKGVSRERQLRKVEETVSRLISWRKLIDSDLVVLKQFQETVSRLAKEPEDVELSPSSLRSGPLRNIIMNLKQRINDKSPELVAFDEPANDYKGVLDIIRNMLQLEKDDDLFLKLDELKNAAFEYYEWVRKYSEWLDEHGATKTEDVFEDIYGLLLKQNDLA